MMRNVKFKGRTEGGLWLTGDLVHRHGGLAIRPVDNYGCPFGYKVIEESVGQFTGFVDATGQEIYEGDTLMIHYVYDVDESDETEYRVRWDESEGCWVLEPDDDCEYLTQDSARTFVAVQDRRWL